MFRSVLRSNRLDILDSSIENNLNNILASQASDLFDDIEYDVSDASNNKKIYENLINLSI